MDYLASSCPFSMCCNSCCNLFNFISSSANYSSIDLVGYGNGYPKALMGPVICRDLITF